MPTWLVLMASLPPHPSSLRVRVWRKLKALGAVALKKSVYVLPHSGDNLEQLQWLAQEVDRAGGEATLFRVDRIENLTHEQVIERFNTARGADYRALGARLRALARGVERGRGRVRGARLAEEWNRLARELQRVREVDFFGAPGFDEAARLRDTIEMRLHPAEGPATPAGRLEIGAFRGRRWVTRPRPHVDRLASAWLIRRFIDPGARFVLARPEDFPPDAVPFDALGAELGHQDDDCTFETIVKRFGLSDPRLAEIGQIVHDVDLRDRKFRREEARGVELAVRGLVLTVKDDDELLAQGAQLFDALFAALGELR